MNLDLVALAIMAENVGICLQIKQALRGFSSGLRDACLSVLVFD
jgi:hypothetical protein